MKNKKLKTMLLSLGLVGTIGVGATLAYFSDGGSVKNTFSFAKGAELTLDEAYVDPDTHIADKGVGRVYSNKYNQIQPGELLPKDPTVHLTSDVDVYLYVAIKNENEANLNFTVTDGNDDNKNWEKVDVPSVNGEYKLYRYNNGGMYNISSPDEPLNIPVFDTVQVSDDLNEYAGNADIEVAAVAVQYKGFEDDEQGARNLAIEKLNDLLLK